MALELHAIATLYFEPSSSRRPIRTLSLFRARNVGVDSEQ